LETKIAITRRLSAAGADIHALNEVRRCLSQVKGGRLAKACNARRIVGLILSDVLGDPLSIIASGPTVTSPGPNPRRAADILESYCPAEFHSVVAHLREQSTTTESGFEELSDQDIVDHHILANNATAVDAAGTHAVALGYRYWMQASTQGEGPADALGIRLARQLLQTCESGLVNCLITGGEPTVVLPDESIRGKGGRNQQLVLAAGEWLLANAPSGLDFAFVSGGTDGEDGPTSAAGAWIDSPWLERNRLNSTVLQDHLRRCDAFSLFERSGNLLVTGPTHTNVCDLRVAVIRSSGSR
jgi:glycerate 2-kinase